MAAKEADIYAWIDTETTGFNPNFTELLEVALIITDRQLNILDETGYQSAIFAEKDWVENYLEHGDQFIVDMHSKTGLWDRLPTAPALETVQSELTEYLESFNRVPGAKPRMAGSSVAFDRGFLEVHMPQFSGHFHHRLIDVSTVTGLIEGFGGEGTQKKYAHAAMDDIRESIDLMRFYRKNYFTI